MGKRRTDKPVTCARLPQNGTLPAPSRSDAGGGCEGLSGNGIVRGEQLVRTLIAEEPGRDRI